MGAFASRRNHGVEEVDISTNNAYRYPPKSGCYFGSHFIMGGDRFETTQPEAYLFGENQDLNFLGNRPVPFPYPAPQAHEPTKTLKSLVNIRKDSLRFIRYFEDDATSSGSDDRQSTSEIPKSPGRVSRSSVSKQASTSPSRHRDSLPDGAGDASSMDTHPAEENTQSAKYNIEFTFDSDVKCAITIYYFAVEEISNKQAFYRPKDPCMNSETFHYKRGANQVFCQTTHIVEPSKFSEEEWQYNPDKEVIPVVIQCVVEEEEYVGHSHMTFGIVEKGEQGYSLKPLKQKQMVDGLCYLLQEIYGIENKKDDRPKDDDLEDNGSECVICLVEMRDTLILPCRHLCLCNCCADNLRYQASNCPICRSPFRALLQIRAMRKKMLPLASQIAPPTADSSDEASGQDGVPVGYETVSLIEALNGPSAVPANNVGVNTAHRNFPDGEDPVLDRLLAEATGRPGTPEDSPVIGRRKLRRKTSTSSNRSRQSTLSTCLDDGRDVTEELVTGEDKDRHSNTPEVIMTDISDPSKSPTPKKFNMPKIRYPVSKAVLNEPEYEVINEQTMNDTEHDSNVQYDAIKVDIMDETRQEVDPGDNDVEIAEHDSNQYDYGCYPDDTDPDVDFVQPSQAVPIAVPRDNEDNLSLPGVEPVGSVSRGLQRHPRIRNRGPESGEGQRDTGIDCLDISGTDHPDSSASSYSSTESTKQLLEQEGGEGEYETMPNA